MFIISFNPQPYVRFRELSKQLVSAKLEPRHESHLFEPFWSVNSEAGLV